MEPLTAGAVAEVCGATVQSGSPETVVERVCTDSRQVQPGDLFIALRGPRFDGHDFVADALERGARAVVVERGRVGELPARTGAVLGVDDSLAALQRLAAWYRRRMRDPAVVAVTGSVGKTTTKEMVAAALSGLGAVVKAPASFNNEVGVPLVILAAGPGTRALVLEIGMRGPGQIRHLAGVAAPTVGVVTNVGESHVGLLGSVEAIARAKAELVESLQPGATAVLNGDDERVRAMARLTRDGVRVLTFGSGAGCDVRLQAVEGGGLGGTRLELEYRGQRAGCRLAVPGRHMAINAAAAVAAALACGVELEAAARGLDGFAGAAMRMEVIRTADDIVLLNDAYNASPTSMRAALETLGRVAAEERRRAVAILGDMLELGALAPQAHRGIGREAAERGVDLLVAVGEMAGEMAAGAREGAAGSEMAIVMARDAEHAVAVACRQVQAGDAVLVKASRAMGLDGVVRALVRAHPPADGAGGRVPEEAEPA
ncbi:UDP-N-acetylmuramoyl-tripeptide--D-alanyl-D-alanine ligase [Geochorda subterranea]|uniref:UDP-N-acetylmuramoyl-tripeptide--D-alanyl-D-alanine ligase n=1 Tax=Geochorda subterranea TaxID=3109564 RepID=A0ABZ1BT40_9FIRM|nr:UDP-N-acetylmuramoyl-tripeptide--D-alanyl-D-alanine ligase [Limnochorda sp. LNt]WRP15934.1 UDP-N-acetylmuramoyl-tripeptide--D-alanyl-D-alanine ligase [Limnochorda sp. LNt]